MNKSRIEITDIIDGPILRGFGGTQKIIGAFGLCGLAVTLHNPVYQTMWRDLASWGSFATLYPLGAACQALSVRACVVDADKGTPLAQRREIGLLNKFVRFLSPLKY